MLFITVILVRTGYDILPITFDRVPLDIRDDSDYLRGLAWDHRMEDESVIVRGSAAGDDSGSGEQDERSVTGEFVEMYWEIADGGNVFTKVNLQAIKQVEDDFFQDEEFQNKFCLLDGNNECQKSRSILRFFDGTHQDKNPIFNDPNFDNVMGVLRAANANPTTKRLLQYHLGKDAVIDETQTYSPATRSLLLLGLPLKDFANTSDREDEQGKNVDRFFLDTFAPKGEAYFRDGVGEMQFFFGSGSLIFVTITSQVFKDLALAIGSFVFIILFMCIQTGSLWVSLFANLSIFTGFCCANLIYRVILDFRYFGTFHVLAVFIILGIGADDVFVFYDSWKETRHHRYLSLAHRLSDCYRKASLAMFFTSLTTAIAFIVSATSPFLGISSFGVFAGLLVMVNYISVILFFPAVVIMYHTYFEKYKCCCCCPRSSGSVQNIEQDPEPERKHHIVRFFRGPYYRFISHKIVRWVILVCFTGLLSMFIYFATTLKVNEEQVR